MDKYSAYLVFLKSIDHLKSVLRLIFETEEHCFVVHRMANSRIYEGRPEVTFDLDIEVQLIVCLLLFVLFCFSLALKLIS